VQRIAAAPSIFLPAVVVGELCFGAQKSTQTALNLRKIDDLAARSHVLPCDIDTARIYGQVKNELRTLGRPSPDNDIWIAATAMQHQLPLLTRDAHFRHVAALTLETC
jgi:tRNA(fMet)-specific endonuclease VapC